MLAYVKVHWDAAERELASAEAAAAALGADDPHLRLPRVLAASLPDGALVLEPLAGRRLDGLADRRARAGAARARRRRSPRCTPSGRCRRRRFDRLDADRLALAADVIGRARPDCRARPPALLGAAARAAAATAPATRCTCTATPTCATRCSTATASRCVDLEDAAAGPGRRRPRLRARRAARRARAGPARAAAEQDALGRGAARRLRSGGASPSADALRWHTAASVLARVAVPAVSRVRPRVLARLEPLLRARRGAGCA